MADSLALLSEAPARAGYTLGRRSLPADRLAPRLRRVTSMIRGPAEGLPTALMRAVMLGATCAGIMGGMPACSRRRSLPPGRPDLLLWNSQQPRRSTE
jgi:hypothetical protein